MQKFEVRPNPTYLEHDPHVEQLDDKECEAEVDVHLPELVLSFHELTHARGRSHPSGGVAVIRRLPTDSQNDETDEKGDEGCEKKQELK